MLPRSKYGLQKCILYEPTADMEHSLYSYYQLQLTNQA